MIKILQGLGTHFDKDYEIGGVVDPFLQMKILKFFRIMGKGDPTVSEEISTVLANVTAISVITKSDLLLAKDGLEGRERERMKKNWLIFI